jgi:hypothetical protein
VNPNAAGTLAEGLWHVAQKHAARTELPLATHRLGRARCQAASPGG